MKTEQKNFLKQVTGQESFPFVMEEVAATTSGFVVSEDALEKLVDAAMNNSADANKLPLLQQELDAANTAKENLQTELNAAKETITAKETELSTATARIEELENEGTITQTTKESDKNQKTGKGSFHASEDNPINKMADALLGAPKAKAE